VAVGLIASLSCPDGVGGRQEATRLCGLFLFLEAAACLSSRADRLPRGGAARRILAWSCLVLALTWVKACDAIGSWMVAGVDLTCMEVGMSCWS
jgi:hypothetical protein